MIAVLPYWKVKRMAHSPKQLQVIGTFGTWAMCNNEAEILAHMGSGLPLNKMVLHSGVVGCGKSFAIAEGFGYLCMKLQAMGIINFNFVIAGQSQNSVKKNFCKELNKAFPGHFKFDGSVKNGIAKDAVLFGQNLYLIGLADAKSEERIRGLSDIRGAICEELTLFSEDQFNLMTARIRGELSEHDKYILQNRFPDFLDGFIIGSTNPGAPTHWLVKYIQDGRFKLIKWTMKDACWEGNETFYEDRMKQWKDTPVLYKRNLLGLWCANDGGVYPGFSVARHCYSSKSGIAVSYISMQRTMLGLDCGSNHPTALLIISRNYSGQYIISDSKRIERTAPSDIATEVGEWYDMLMGFGNFTGIWCDPAAQYMQDELRKRGMRVWNAKNDHVKGINYIRGLLGTDNLVIDFDKCNDLVVEMGSYSFKSKDSDEVIKLNDDFVDALRYGCYSDYLRYELREE